jgi:galactose oxidase
MVVHSGPADAAHPDTGHARHEHRGVAPVSVQAARLPRTGWTVTADSQETAAENGAAGNVLDGDPATFWHSKWSGTADPLPHTLIIDMQAAATVTGVRYRPRPGGGNGTIGQYRVEVSLDGTTWGAPVGTGTWADDAAAKTATLSATSARFVRLTALTEAGGRGPWTSAAEVDVLGTPATIPASVLPRTGWTATADSQETAAENGAAANVLDGDPATFWHSKWSGTADPLPHTLIIDMQAAATVTGVRYRPRPGGGNGTIGQYRVEVSLDGTTWGAPVAAGTWADDAAEKTAAFFATRARYVRLTALTEAGRRGPWTSAAEIDLLGSDEPPTSGGRWDAPIGFPLVPAAAAMLPTGRVLAWSAFAPDSFGGASGFTTTAVLDPGTGTVSQETVTATGHDMFCPGTALLGDGRLLVNGGSNSDKTSIYDPVAASWTAGSPLVTPRGYQSAVTTATGEVFTLGGSWSGGTGDKNGELWSPTSGSRALPGALIGPALTADPGGIYRADNHLWLFTWTDGRVFQAGPSRAMNWYGVTGNGSTTAAGPRSDDTDAMNGNAVMYEPGRILTVGGAPAYENADATRNAYLVDITGPAVGVDKLAPMAHARSFANAVVLPDGGVLVIGGQNVPVPFSDDTAVLTPELWNPATRTFAPLAPMAVPRTYHSVALLLPDGRVFSGGGGLCGGCPTNHFDGQIFTPPYLLDADGSPRPRPTITAAPADAAAGSTISATTEQGVAGFSLVRLGSATHTVDTDQRRVPLTISGTSGTTSTLALPADRGVLVPGYYMLFALDAAGVPSLAKIVKIS